MVSVAVPEAEYPLRIAGQEQLPRLAVEAAAIEPLTALVGKITGISLRRSGGWPAG